MNSYSPALTPRISCQVFTLLTSLVTFITIRALRYNSLFHLLCVSSSMDVCVFTGEGKMGVMVLANALLVCNSVCYSPPMLDCCHYQASSKHTHRRTILWQCLYNYWWGQLNVTKGGDAEQQQKGPHTNSLPVLPQSSCIWRVHKMSNNDRDYLH